MSRKTVDVAAAIIWDEPRILICRRPEGKDRGLLWEFPGGKIEEGESPEEALRREIREELGTDVRVLGTVAREEYDYPDLRVRLRFYNALATGEPRRLEHADMRWILPSRAADFDFCPADESVLSMLADGRVAAPEPDGRRNEDA